MSSTYWMTRDVQYGFKPKLGTQNKFYKTLYSSFYRRTSSSTKRHPDYLYGGVFNLEFSPDSSILISAREKNAFILWDPISLEEIKVVENAHHDCVNCIKLVLKLSKTPDVSYHILSIDNFIGRLNKNV